MQPRRSDTVEPLRRADWRFLLAKAIDRPIPDLLLRGGPDDLPDLLLREGIAERVHREIAGGRRFDAVILLDTSLGLVRESADVLAPGGSLYADFDRRRWSSLRDSPARVGRSLAAAGLTVTGAYWIRPDLVRRQVYVPWHEAGALGWYLRSLVTAATPAERVLEVVLRSLERLGRSSFAALAPCYGITAARVPVPGGTLPAAVRHESLPADIRNADPHVLLITQGKEDFKRITVLPFASGAQSPLAALKLARRPEFNDPTRAEQDLQRTIRSAMDPAMRDSIPEPLGLVECGGVPIGVESVAPGRSIASNVNRWGVPLRRKIEELHRAAEWLTEFNCGVQIERSNWSTEDVSEWIETPFAEYAAAFGLTSAEERIFSLARARATSLIDVSLPTVWVHWDFSEYNVYSSDRDITVLDWERATPGPPLMDLLFFVTIWSYSARNLGSDAARLDAFQQLFCLGDRTDPVSAVALEVFTRYMAEVGVDRRFLPLLLVVVCVKRALIHLGRRDGARATKTADPRARNPYIDWLNILAEDSAQQFPEESRAR